jgi:hypothetical protein
MKVAEVKGGTEKMCNDDKSLLDMDCSVPNGGFHSPALSMIDPPLPEGRVHGGGLLALLSQVTEAQALSSRHDMDVRSSS